MTSIRATLTTTLMTGVVVAAGVAGWILYSQTGKALTAAFDRALLAKARGLAAGLELEGRIVEFNYQDELMPEFEGGPSPEYFEVWLSDGRVLKRSGTMERDDGDMIDLPFRYGEGGVPRYWDQALPDGRAGRAVGMVVELVGDTDDDDDDDDDEDDGFDLGDSIAAAPMVVAVARSRAEIDDALAALRTALAIAAAVLLAGTTSIVALAVGRGLRPLYALGREVERIDADSLSHRVPVDQLPRELRSMGDKLNELLERLERAFQRERRMTGNVAHELRTPIAELKAAVDVARRWPDDAALTESAIETAHAVSMRMGDVVSGLLRLARIASGATRLEIEPFSLRDLIDHLWSGVSRTAAERQLEFRHDTPADLVVRTDRTLLSIALSNLLDNATRFADRGSTIRCRTSTNGDPRRVAVTLENRAAGLAEVDLDNLTEPFWQKDAARSDGDHAGLGLTLVATTARVLDLELRFEIDDGLRVAFHGLEVDPAARADATTRPADATRH